MSEEEMVLRAQLQRYIASRNALRSCLVAAEGLGSRSVRAANLRQARNEHDTALRDLAPWLEAIAREKIGINPTPMFNTKRYGEVL